mmetsp:Transcript_35095/g.76087  ORF Transcript_35095/g.76087 Transcript_35095/m.76087 type:complete len:305 (-) Transcript_35095:885-1799(-)
MLTCGIGDIILVCRIDLRHESRRRYHWSVGRAAWILWILTIRALRVKLALSSRSQPPRLSWIAGSSKSCAAPYALHLKVTTRQQQQQQQQEQHHQLRLVHRYPSSYGKLISYPRPMTRPVLSMPTMSSTLVLVMRSGRCCGLSKSAQRPLWRRHRRHHHHQYMDGAASPPPRIMSMRQCTTFCGLCVPVEEGGGGLGKEMDVGMVGMTMTMKMNMVIRLEEEVVVAASPPETMRMSWTHSTPRMTATVTMTTTMTKSTCTTAKRRTPTRAYRGTPTTQCGTELREGIRTTAQPARADTLPSSSS